MTVFRCDDVDVPSDRGTERRYRFDVSTATEDDDGARRFALVRQLGRMRRVERLHDDLDIAAASEAEAEDDVVETGTVVGDDARAEVIAPRLRTLGEVALEASAADRSGCFAILGDHASRAGAAIRGALRIGDGSDDAALSGRDDPLH